MTRPPPSPLLLCATLATLLALLVPSPTDAQCVPSEMDSLASAVSTLALPGAPTATAFDGVQRVAFALSASDGVTAAVASPSGWTLNSGAGASAADLGSSVEPAVQFAAADGSVGSGDSVLWWLSGNSTLADLHVVKTNTTGVEDTTVASEELSVTAFQGLAAKGGRAYVLSDRSILVRVVSGASPGGTLDVLNPGTDQANVAGAGETLEHICASPDGSKVYVTATTGSGTGFDVLEFSRDAGDGSLSGQSTFASVTDVTSLACSNDYVAVSDSSGPTLRVYNASDASAVVTESLAASTLMFTTDAKLIAYTATTVRMFVFADDTDSTTSVSTTFSGSPSNPVLFSSVNGAETSGAFVLIDDANVRSYTRDIVTSPPTVVAPAASATYGSIAAGGVPVEFTTADCYAVANLVVDNGGATSTLALAATMDSSGTLVNFTFDSENPTASSDISSGAALPASPLTMTFSLRDCKCNPINEARSFGSIEIDLTTATPALSNPGSNDHVGATFSVTSTLPEAPETDSIEVLFESAGGAEDFTIGVLGSSTSVSIPMQQDLTAVIGGGASFSIDPPARTTLAEVDWNITLSYKDAVGNARVSSATVHSVTFDVSADPPTVTTPAPDTEYTTETSIEVAYNLPEAANSANLVFIPQVGGGSDITLVLAGAALSAGDVTFDLVYANPSSEAEVASGSAIPDGIYNVRLEYTDEATPGNSNSLTVSNVTISARPAQLTVADITDTTGTISWNFQGAVPDDDFALTFEQTTGGSDVIVFTIDSAANSVTIDVEDPTTPTTNVLAVTPSDAGAFVQGEYTVSVSMTRTTGGAVSASQTGILVDYETLPFTIDSPVDGSTVTEFHINFTLPEDPASNSVRLAVTPTGGSTSNFVLATRRDFDFVFSQTGDGRIGSGDVVLALSGNPDYTDGEHTLELQYRDSQHSAVFQTTTIVLDTVTQVPALYAPDADSTYTSSSPVLFNYTLAETPQNGSVELTFTSESGSDAVYQWTLGDTLSGAFSYSERDTQPGSVASFVALPDDTYTVALAYQDEASNVAAEVNVTGVRIDFVTEQPTLGDDVAPGTYNSLSFQVQVPEAQQADSVRLLFSSDGGSSVIPIVLNALTPETPTTITLNPANLSDPSTNSGVNVVASGRTTLPDSADGDSYSVTLQYQDDVSNPVSVATTELTGLIVDTVTQGFVSTPSISSDTSYRAPLQLSFEVGELPRADSLFFSFENVVTDPEGAIYVMVNDTTASLSYDVAWELDAAGGVFVITRGTVEADGTLTATGSPLSSVPDGTYDVALSYVDVLSNAPAATFSVTDVTIDTVTEPATLRSPASGLVTTRTVLFRATLDERPGASTNPAMIMLVNVDEPTTNATIFLNNNIPASSFPYEYVFAWNADSPSTLQSDLAPGPYQGPIVPDGTYNLTLSYGDEVGNPVATAQSELVVVDGRTLPPSLAVTDSTTRGRTIPLTYEVPEEPLTGTATITVKAAGTGDVVTTITLSDEATSTPTDLVIDPATRPEVVSGAYTVELSYQDQLSHAAATASVSFTVDTETLPPTMTSPVSNSTVAQVFVIECELPETPFGGTVQLQVLQSDGGAVQQTWTLSDLTSFEMVWNVSTAPGLIEQVALAVPDEPLPDGEYDIVLQYQDDLGNAAASVQVTSVTVATGSGTPTLVSPAAGAGVFTSSNNLAFELVIPNDAEDGSIQLQFTSATTAPYTLVVPAVLGQTNYSVGPWTAPSTAPPTGTTLGSASASLADGTYDLTLSYTNVNGEELSAEPVQVVIDYTTLPAVLEIPTKASVLSDQMLILYSLGDVPAASPAPTIEIIEATSGQVAVELTLTTAQTGTIVFPLESVVGAWDSGDDPTVADIQATPSLLSSSGTLPLGRYELRLAYRDASGNGEQSTTVAPVYLIGDSPAVRVTLTLTTDFSTIPSSKRTVARRKMPSHAWLTPDMFASQEPVFEEQALETRAEFETGFLEDIAAATGEDQARFLITDVSPSTDGSGTVVIFDVLPPGPFADSDLSADAVVALIRSLVALPSSALYSGSITSAVSSGSEVRSFQVCRNAVQVTIPCSSVEEEDVSSDDGDDSLGLLLIIVIGAAVLVTLIVGIVLHRRDRRNKKDPDKQGPEEVPIDMDHEETPMMTTSSQPQMGSDFAVPGMSDSDSGSDGGYATGTPGRVQDPSYFV